MAIKTYSRSRQGGVRLSPHFLVREFACNDGTDTILIDDALVGLLERIRFFAGGAVRLTSAYRTAAYNRRIGGATASYHTKGQAADVITDERTPAEVARFAQAIGAGGVGLYTSQRFVHVDTRAGHYYWRNAGSGDAKVSGHGGACPYAVPKRDLRRGSSGSDVRWLQWWLTLWGYPAAVDGSFGSKTDAALRAFQRRAGIAADGIAGVMTRRTLGGEAP